MERRFLKSGIPGLDSVLGGGFLEGSIVTVSGPTGSGKSTLAVQFLYNGAKESNEPGMYVMIEENRHDFFFHMSGYEWDLASAEKERKVLLLDYPVHEVDQILSQYSAVQQLINANGIKRVVIDSIMPIALFFPNEDERKRGFLKLMENIRKWNVTTLLISEDIKAGEPGSVPNTAFGIETYSDGWVNISYNYDEKRKERTRYLEVLKMKGVAHSSRSHPIAITSKGVSLLQEAPAMVPPPIQAQLKEGSKPTALPKQATQKPVTRKLALPLRKPK